MRIYVVRVSPASGRIRKQQVSGSGVVVSPDGYVVTNHHVAANAKRLTCTLADKEEIGATLIGTDPLADIAVLKLKLEERSDPTASMPYATWGDSDRVRVGDKVFAMGSPAAVSQSVTQGIISNTELIAPKSMRASFKLDGEDVGSMVRWLAHDAIIFGGNSGGPLVNTEGELIGINEIGLASLSGAIPGNLARRVVEQIIQHGKVTRAWMGFSVQPLPKLMTDKDGALVATVMPASPAQHAGLMPGDIVTHIEGNSVSVRVAEQVPLFNCEIAERKTGEPTTLTVLRGNETLEINVSPDERQRNLADAVELKSWGITARNMTRLMAIAKYRDNQEGVMVDGVRAGGPAGDAKPSLSRGDIITHIGDQKISNIADLRKTTRKLLDPDEDTTPVLVRVVRSLEQLLTVVEVGDAESNSKPIETQRPSLGVTIQVLTRELAKAIGFKGKKGVRLTSIFPEQPAAEAGLEVGDVLVSIDEDPIEASRPADVSVFREMLDNYDIGDEVEMGVMRGDEELTISVKLKAPPTPSDRVAKYEDDDFEFTARNLTPIDRMVRRLEKATPGVWVQEVQSSGWASLAGLRSGDIIMRLGDKAVDNVETLEEEFSKLDETKPDHVLLFIRRGISTAFLELEPAWEEAEEEDAEN